MKKFIFGDKSTGSIKKKKLKGTVVLSFFVSLFAVFSLIVCGISEDSYAIGIESDNFGLINSYPYYISVKNSNNTSQSMRVNQLFASANDPVFCVQHGINIPRNDDNVIYTKNLNTKIEDSEFGLGLLYILANSYYNDDFLKGSSPEVRYYATQAAIWYYSHLYYIADENGVSKNPDATTREQHSLLAADNDGYEIIDVIKNASSFEKINATASFTDPDAIISLTVCNNAAATNGGTLCGSSVNVGKIITDLVSDAFDFSQDDELFVSTIPQELSLAKNSNGEELDYYQSEKVDVSSSRISNLLSYTVSLSGLDGAYIVDSNGQTVDATYEFSPNDSFWIRVPKDKVSKSVKQTISVDVNGKFNMLTGYYFTAQGYQTVLSVGSSNSVKTAKFNVEVIGAPDTGMTTAQTIYFIGLIVLLCGIGIVYANAKPSEIKQ